MNPRKVRDIDYLLLPGSDRKTTDIVIERDGAVTVRPPKHLTPKQVDELIDRKRMWIYRNLAEWKDLNSTSVVREWVNGETFLYLGRAYRLSLVSNQNEELKLVNGRFCLDRKSLESKGKNAAKAAFESFYCRKGTTHIEKLLTYYAPKVGVKLTSVQIKDIGYKWGYCTNSNAVGFHWKCMMSPPKIIAYIVVHELCHIHERNHNDAFWNEVDKVMPDYLERKNWLRKYGAGLDL